MYRERMEVHLCGIPFLSEYSTTISESEPYGSFERSQNILQISPHLVRNLYNLIPSETLW